MSVLPRPPAIDEKDLEWVFVRAPGPGGQNVNKVATAVQLRFNVAKADYLAPAVVQRLRHFAGRRMTKDGYLIISASRFRTQERNREDALQRLQELLASASVAPKRRIPTKPSTAVRQRRLDTKRTQSVKKRRRGLISEND